MKARIAGLDRRLEEAAMDLGDQLDRFRKVTFPLILLARSAAGSLALSSRSTFIITSFVSGTTNTFPLGLQHHPRTRCRCRSTWSAR